MNIMNSLDGMLIKGKIWLSKTKPANDQMIVMFIIIAVAAGVAGLLYNYSTGTLLPAFESKLSTLVDKWFNGN